jgi:hypothetical protein
MNRYINTTISDSLLARTPNIITYHTGFIFRRSSIFLFTLICAITFSFFLKSTLLPILLITLFILYTIRLFFYLSIAYTLDKQLSFIINSFLSSQPKRFKVYISSLNPPSYAFYSCFHITPPFIPVHKPLSIRLSDSSSSYRVLCSNNDFIRYLYTKSNTTKLFLIKSALSD